jgi:hypothetical protein
MPAKTALQYYVITSPLQRDVDNCKRYGDFKEAAKFALEMSRYTPGIEYSIMEIPSMRLISNCKNGMELMVVQRRLDGFLDDNYTLKVGKMYWKHWQKEAIKIAFLKSKLQPKEMEIQIYKSLQADLNNHLTTIKPHLGELTYTTCEYEHLIVPLHKHSRSKKPIELTNYSRTTITRRLRMGYIETGHIATEEKWELIDEDD